MYASRPGERPRFLPDFFAVVLRVAMGLPLTEGRAYVNSVLSTLPEPGTADVGRTARVKPGEEESAGLPASRDSALSAPHKRWSEPQHCEAMPRALCSEAQAWTD